MPLFRRTKTQHSFDIETTLHGSCPSCHHFHGASPIKLHFSRNKKRQTPISCQRCGHEHTCLGGLYPRESMASQESIPLVGTRRLSLGVVRGRQRGGTSIGSSDMRSSQLYSEPSIESYGIRTADPTVVTEAASAVGGQDVQQQTTSGALNDTHATPSVLGLRKRAGQRVSKLMSKIRERAHKLSDKVRIPNMKILGRSGQSNERREGPGQVANEAGQFCPECEERLRKIRRGKTEEREQEAAAICRGLCYGYRAGAPAISVTRSDPSSNSFPTEGNRAATPEDLRGIGLHAADADIPRNSNLSLTSRMSLASTVIAGAGRRPNADIMADPNNGGQQDQGTESRDFAGSRRQTFG